VARYCARSFNLPTTIARMAPRTAIRAVSRIVTSMPSPREAAHTRCDPMTYSPIHDDDICDQLEPLIGGDGTGDHRELGR
jgi:hypothetical protein